MWCVYCRLLRKYTTVTGCIPAKSTVYSSVKRMREAQLGAIQRHIADRKVWISRVTAYPWPPPQVWVATDEWTSDTGLAILNILVGYHGNVYVTGTVQLQCPGPSLGVEHEEVVRAILDNLNDMQVKSSNVISFVSDSASVLKKAFDAILSVACPNTRYLQMP